MRVISELKLAHRTRRHRFRRDALACEASLQNQEAPLLAKSKSGASWFCVRALARYMYDLAYYLTGNFIAALHDIDTLAGVVDTYTGQTVVLSRSVNVSSDIFYT